MSSVLEIDRSPSDVTAELLGEVGESDLDGHRWEFLISDRDSSGTICAELSGSASRGESPSREELETAIESFAGHFAREHRLAEMLAEYNALGAYQMKVEDLGLTVFRRPPLRVVPDAD